jgi:hypothetical protein
MCYLILAAALWSDPSLAARPIDLDTIKPDNAWALNGIFVKSTFPITCLADTHGKTTVIGTGWDVIERVAHIPENLMIDKGDEVTVYGFLRVIPHRAEIVNRQFIPEWLEIRISGYEKKQK